MVQWSIYHTHLLKYKFAGCFSQENYLSNGFSKVFPRHQFIQEDFLKRRDAGITFLPAATRLKHLFEQTNPGITG